MDKISLSKKYIEESNYIVALTGAGISTNAGIPDFRGEKGIYTTGKVRPEEVFDIDYFLRDPEPFYNWAKELLAMMEKAKPTIAHKSLARLEEMGKLKSVITQNIDNLHQKAGNKNVIELHGTLTQGFCVKCGRKYSGEEINKMLKTGIPRCECGGIIKPDIVFFGEPVQGLNEAQLHSKNADLFLVVGSSLMVQPASILPYFTKGRMVILSKGLVAFPEERIDLKFDEDIDNVFEKVMS